MHLRVVSRITGILLLLITLAMAACGLFARLDVVAGDHEAMLALFQSAAITGLAGLSLIALGGWKLRVERILRREAVVIVGLGWFLSSAFGALPFILCPPGLDPAAAFFEAASGFTTTGSSVIPVMEEWPRGILLWRAVTQWLGGIGILVLFVAMLSYLGVSSKSLFQNESSFRGGEAGVGRIQDTALMLLRIYLVLGLVCCLGLRAMGLTWFHSVCHAMATVSTGGYSPHTASVGFYSDWGNGWLIESWIGLFMLACSLNFLLFIVILRRNWRRLRSEEDARWFLGICGGVILLISFGRWLDGSVDLVPALRDAFFVVATIASSCGFGTADYQTWPAWAQVLIAILMLVGGCAGSTSGGMKVGRLVVFLKSARHEIIRSFRPNQVFRLVMNGKPLAEDMRARTLSFISLYLMLLVFSTAVVGALEAGSGISLETCAGAALATLSNIGPGFGEVGPSGNFAELRPATHWFLSWLMILGRLELFAVLVLFFPTAWRNY